MKNFNTTSFFLIIFLVTASLQTSAWYTKKNQVITNNQLKKTDCSSESPKQNPLHQADSLTNAGMQASLRGDNDEALQNFEHAYQYYEKTQQTYKQVKLLLAIGEIQYNWAKYDKALYYFLKAYAGSKQYLFKDLEVTSLNYIGKHYHSVGNFKKSIENYEKAYLLALTIHDTLGIVAIQNKIGKHYETLGNYAKSLEYYMQSERMLDAIDDEIEKATTYNHLGNTYHLLKAYDKALNFHNKALNQRKKLHYKEGMAKSLNNLAEVLMDLKLDDSAMHCLDASMKICQDLGYTKGLIKCYQNQGIILNKHDNSEKAIKKFQTAQLLSEQIGYDLGILNALYSLASSYQNLGNYQLAINYAKKGLQLAQQKNVRENLRQFNYLLANVFETINQADEALKYYKAYHTVNEEMVSLETNKKIAELETQYQVNLQRKINETLKQENQIKALSIKRKNSALLFSFISLILLISLIIIFISRYRQKQKAHQELSELNSRITIQNQELDKLNQDLHKSIKQQMKLFSIISHELRNPLWWFRNLIQMLSQKLEILDKDMIRKSLDSMYESANQTFHLMDNLLHWSKSQLGHTKLKIEPFDINRLLIDAIAMIQQFAQYKQLKIKYSPVPNVSVLADKNMIQTVVRNLLSNAVKYTPEGGAITITLMSGASATISIKDTGPGLDDKTLTRLNNDSTDKTNETMDAGTGLGLILSKEFVALNGSKLLVNSNVENGTIFYFSLPLYIEDSVKTNKKEKITVQEPF